jgi:hypothetical protein
MDPTHWKVDWSLFPLSITFAMLMRNSSGTLVIVYLMLLTLPDMIESEVIGCMNGRISQPYNLDNLYVQ